MKKEKSLKEELREIAPGLEKLPAREKPEVPEGYFASLPDKVIARLREEGEMSGQPRKSALRSLYPRIGLLAAVLTAFAIAAFFLLKNNGASELTAELSSEEAYLYVMNNVDDFDSGLLINSLDVETLTDIEATDMDDIDALYEMVIDDIELEDLEGLY